MHDLSCFSFKAKWREGQLKANIKATAFASSVCMCKIGHMKDKWLVFFFFCPICTREKRTSGVCSAGLQRPPRYLAVLRCCYFLPEWRQRGCSLVNCGGGLDASRLYYWPVFLLESSSRPAEGYCYWFCSFLFLILYLFFSPMETDLPADFEWLAKGRLKQNRSCSISNEFWRYYQECWPGSAYSACERSCSHKRECEGRIRGKCWRKQIHFLWFEKVMGL